MSLDAILEAIQAAGQGQVCAIEEQAQAQAHDILADARTDAQRAHKEARATAFAPAAGERAQRIHQASLEALKNVGEESEKLVDGALHQVRGRLASIRTDPSYPAVLRCLIEEALADLRVSPEDIQDSILEADPRDRILLEKILFNLGLELLVRYELDCWGGAIAKGADARVVVINTLEARLERATPYLRRHLAAMFEGGRPESKKKRYEIGSKV